MSGKTPETTAEDLHRSHARRLLDFALGRARDEHEARDVVQETLGVAIEKGAPPGREGPWLFRVARNKLMKLAERRAVRREVVLEAPALEPVQEAPGPGEALSAREERERVLAALATLDEGHAALVRLVYEEGLSHREVAERLSVPATTVQARLRAALRALHRQLISRSTPIPGPRKEEAP
jgi:RNA polymerase sigma-70 factor (ECF subfamily)